MTAAEPAERRLPLWATWLFVLLMLSLTAVFAALGWWQVQRLAEKETLAQTIGSRLHLGAVPLPPVREWVGFDAEIYDLRPLSITGSYVHDQAVLVFTSLPSAGAQYSGPGYWVMTPFALTGGGTIFVNRGFVPEQLAGSFATDATAPPGEVTVTGIGRAPEEITAFTPPPEHAQRIDWVRHPERLGALVDAALAPIAPITLDLPPSPSGALPQAVASAPNLSNNHLGYAITWFGFAALTPVLLLVWLLRRQGN